MHGVRVRRQQQLGRLLGGSICSKVSHEHPPNPASACSTVRACEGQQWQYSMPDRAPQYSVPARARRSPGQLLTHLSIRLH
jgi:hypothetical protein